MKVFASYFFPFLGETASKPNLFSFDLPEYSEVNLGLIKAFFPLQGEFHFRFLQDSHWIDLLSETQVITPELETTELIFVQLKVTLQIHTEKELHDTAFYDENRSKEIPEDFPITKPSPFFEEPTDSNPPIPFDSTPIDSNSKNLLEVKPDTSDLLGIGISESTPEKENDTDLLDFS